MIIVNFSIVYGFFCNLRGEARKLQKNRCISILPWNIHT